MRQIGASQLITYDTVVVGAGGYINITRGKEDGGKGNGGGCGGRCRDGGGGSEGKCGIGDETGKLSR